MLCKFVELFSDFLNSTPKAKSIFKQSCRVLGTRYVHSYSPTRFLDLFRVMENILDQFPVICKLIQLSSSLELKRIANIPRLLLHVDQFVVHRKPLQDLTVELQGTNLDVHSTLTLLLNCLSKISFRLGNSIALSPKSYYKKLYDEDDAPVWLPSKNTSVFYSQTHRHVEQTLHETNDSDLKELQTVWDTYNQELYQRFLKRFQAFMKSPVTRGCYVLFSKLINIKNYGKRNFMELAKAFIVNSAKHKQNIRMKRFCLCLQSQL